MSVQAAHNFAKGTQTGEGRRIGVFDSGVGGLSVLRAIRKHLPLAELVYVADSANAPYGERDDAFIAQRCHAISGFLASQAVDAIVVACNTATAVAVQSLREALPNLPIIGVEPGIKPGIAQSINKRVGVLATPGTLASKKFKALVQAHGEEATLILQPCPGLAKEIESGHLDGQPLRQLVEQFCAPMRQAGVDTVVLGCTHYPFAEALFRDVLGQHVNLLDTSEAVARRTADLIKDAKPQHSTCAPSVAPTTSLWTTGSPQHLSDLARGWLGWDFQAQHLPV